MASAKQIEVKAIARAGANAFVKKCHYSGKVVNNSVLHFGVFWEGKLEGVMQFGSSFDKRKIINLVADTGWNSFLELNRMAFSDKLPRNSESRALGVAFRMIRKHYPYIDWVVSFADATQCGDGTIYRASGFVLTGITKNRSIIRLPNGTVAASMTYTKGKHILKQSGRAAIPTGSELLPGFQMRYIYFLKPEVRQRLAVPVIPFTQIEEVGGGMYKGNKRVKQAMGDDQLPQRRGSTDLHAPNKGEPCRI